MNTLREWLGHESLDVSLAYLKGSEAASEPVQEQVANGALAAFACTNGVTPERGRHEPRTVEAGNLREVKLGDRVTLGATGSVLALAQQFHSPSPQRVQ